MKFGEKLKRLRVEKKMTQKDVASAIGISCRAYIAYEQDSVRPRKRETYKKLAEVLECDVNYLLIDDGAIEAGSKASFLTALGIGLATLSPVGAIATAGVMATALKVIGSRAETVEKNDVGDKILTYNNDMLLQYEKKQRQFQATALGIIFSALARNNVICQLGNIKELDQIGGRPDEYLILFDQNINSWWFTFWAKDTELDAQYIMFMADRAHILFSRFSTAVADPKRMVSIVVNDEELFCEICKFKGHNSYRGNLSVLLIDANNVKVSREEYIAFYDEEIEESQFDFLWKER